MNKTLLALFFISLIYACCKKEKPVTGEFTALTYNVAGLPEPLSSSHPALYTSFISPLINEYDIVHAQEDFCYHDSLLLYNTHPYKTESPGCGVTNSGLSTFAKFPILNHVRIPWTHLSGADALVPKGFSYSQIDFGNGVIIDFYNAHAQAGSSDEPKSNRRSNINQLCTYINEHSSGKPVIIMGDFNSRYTREGDTIRALLDLGFKDAWVETIRGGVLPDYATAALESCDVPRTKPECERVDKVFYRSSANLTINCNSYQVDDPRFYYQGNDTMQLSDHWPTFTKFSYKVEN